MWDLKKIKTLLSNQERENGHLEFKAAEGLDKTESRKKDISKDVSAFANSDGGTLIYGIKEDSDHRADAIDPINSSILTKEWLEQVINYNITPRIHGIIITPISVNATDHYKVVYVIEIPKGITVHQANDKRYYRRFNFTSTPMEDWEIKDIINREQRTIPSVRLRPKFNARFVLDFQPNRGRSLDFDIIAYNKGLKVITLLDFMLITTETAAKRFIPQIPFKHSVNEAYFTNEIENTVELEGQTVVLNKQRMPILTKTYRQIGSISIYTDFFIDNTEVTFIICTDDNRIVEKLKGKEILEDPINSDM
ncbi:MAG: ATP-binding protein [Bacteroidetes bacterium]|nr:ATP-binding protein [Bacteroidota bacterium]